MRCVWFIALLLARVSLLTAEGPIASEPKSSLHLTQEGLLIKAGSAGQFTLNYPVLVGERWDDVRKPIEKRVSGYTATLQFDGPTRIEVVWQPADRSVTFTPINVPVGVKSLRADMLIDFSYVNGGSWQIGQGNEMPFPAQQPAKPHLFQGNADTLKLRNFEGATLTVQVPPYSFQQLTDNRAWDWKIFGWQFSAPCATPAGPLRVKIALGAPLGEAVKLADRFGQSTRSDFPAKVRTEEELKQDVQTERAWLASLQPPALDRFGGLPGSAEKLGLEKCGYFHLEKKSTRWILVDPEGNAFFHLGVCGFGPCDDYTCFAGRERIFEWLPAHEGEFASAFHPDSYWNSQALSFHLVNTIRKTGRPYDPAAYTARMIERVRKWGFNSVGAFVTCEPGVLREMNFPHVAHLPLPTWEGFPDVPGVHGIFDPFSDELRRHCDKLFAARLPPAAADPLIIGYFLANEPLWEEIPGAVTALDNTHPCKRRLATMLEEKYKTIEAFDRAWEVSLGSFAEVAAHGLSVKTRSAKEDMQAFTGIFLEAYFRLVTETFHKYDKNHLLIGNRLQPGTINNETVCRLSGQYMDLVSFNYYTYGFDSGWLDRYRRRNRCLRSPMNTLGRKHGMRPAVVLLLGIAGFARAGTQDAPESLPQLLFHLTARPWTPLNIPRRDYLDAIEGVCRFTAHQQDARGAVIDPFLLREHQYSTPCLAFAVGVLIQAGRAPDLWENGVRAMDHATECCAQGDAGIPDQHGEFFLASLPGALELYRDQVPGEKLARWRRRLGVPREQVVRGGRNNWRTYAMKGEWLRWKAGLADHDQAVAFEEEAWLNAEQRARMANDKWNCYQDHSTDPEPHAVEAVGRGNLLGLLEAGYDGAASGEMRRFVERGTAVTLLLQDPSGQCPPGGRTDDHVFNDVLYQLAFDVMAARANRGGDAALAGQYRHAAIP
jgi:hypothetical protein